MNARIIYKKCSVLLSTENSFRKNILIELSSCRSVNFRSVNLLNAL